MAHHINFNEQTGQHSFFSVKQKAWHGLGQLVSDYPNSQEAIRFAGLDYTVEKRNLLTCPSIQEEEKNNVPSLLDVPHYYATVRTDNDTVLGVVGREYAVVQNREAFSFFDSLVANKQIHYETAGALGKGERIFITAKLPHYIKIGKDDLIEPYLFLTTSHDGFGSITAAFTPIRIVCNNTLTAALKKCSHTVKIRHTINAAERLQQAQQVMGLSKHISASLENVWNHWAWVKITDNQVKQLIQLAMKPRKEVEQSINSSQQAALSTAFKNRCEAVYAYAMGSATQQTETTRGTLFGAYNSITGYFQNIHRYKDETARLKSLLLGGVAQNKTQKAFQLCEAFASRGAAALSLN